MVTISTGKKAVNSVQNTLWGYHCGDLPTDIDLVASELELREGLRERFGTPCLDPTQLKIFLARIEGLKKAKRINELEKSRRAFWEATHSYCVPASKYVRWCRSLICDFDVALSITKNIPCELDALVFLEVKPGCELDLDVLVEAYDRVCALDVDLVIEEHGCELAAEVFIIKNYCTLDADFKITEEQCELAFDVFAQQCACDLSLTNFKAAVASRVCAKEQ